MNAEKKEPGAGRQGCRKKYYPQGGDFLSGTCMALADRNGFTFASSKAKRAKRLMHKKTPGTRLKALAIYLPKSYRTDRGLPPGYRYRAQQVTIRPSSLR